MAYKFQKGAAVLSGALDQEGTIVVKDDNGNVVASFENDGDLSGSGDFELGGSVRLDGVATATLAVGSDSLYFFDATDQLMKKRSVSNFVTDVAGAGLSNESGQLKLEIDGLNALGSAGLAQADHFLFSEEDGTEKKVTFSNLEDSIFGNVSGQAAIAAGGGLSLQAAAITAQTNMTGDVDDGDELMISDGGTLKRVDFSVFRDAVFNDVSGDATVAAGGALTIANDAVEQAMIADDAVGADQLASNAVVNASVVDGALKADKLDIDGSTDIGADLVDADLFIVDDGAGGTNRKSTLTRMKKYIYSAMSGDATASDAGALTISAGAVEASMLNSNVVSASSGLELTAAGLRLSASAAGPGLTFIESGVLEINIDNLSAYNAQTMHQTQDHFLMSDNGIEKKVTFSDLEDSIFANVSGDATIAAGGALTIANDAVEQAMIADDAVGADQLAADAVVNASVVNGSIKADKLDIDGSTDIGADLVDADLLIVDDGAGGTNRKTTLTRMKKYIYSAISGDATVTDSGELSISSNNVNLRAGGETLTKGYNYFADIGSGGSNATVTLPTSGNSTVGDVVTLKAGNLDLPTGKKIIVQVDGGGSATIDDSLTSLELESPFAAISLVYVAADKWRIV